MIGQSTSSSSQRLLNHAIIILLALSQFHLKSAVAFAPRSKLAIQPHTQHKIVNIRSTSLFGYANVNDYFNSFHQDNSDDENKQSLSSLHDADKKGYKYVGHGRIKANDESDDASAGMFDVNNYFASFADESDSSNSVDDVNAFDLLNFNIGPPPIDDEESQTSNSSDNYMLNTADNTQSSNNKQNKMTHSEIIAYNNARLCPKSFLTQSSIQSFIYLLEECRDPHSGKWIQDFLQLPNLSNYHGTGAFNVQTYPRWDSVLIDILRQPNQKMVVSAKRRGRGHGGWSKNNPYLQERWVEFKIDIMPASLVQRLLTVREQLALEFERDLEIVGMVDGMIMESYFCNVVREREEQQQQQQQQGQWSDYDDGGGEAMMTSSHEDTRAFDRISVNILSNFTEFASSGTTSSSPFRKGNFDLLYNLCTQASVHRLLRDLRESKVDSVSYQWLQKFYSERVAEYFDGDQAFGRADDFIDALLRSPPSLVSMDDGQSLGLTDPLRIAERIISKRSEIAHEWIDMMREVKADHLALQDVLFKAIMGKAIDASGSVVDEVVAIEEEPSWEPLADDTGAFE